MQRHLLGCIPRGPTDTASAAAPQKKHAAEEVGRVKCTDSQRDDVVESDREADVDQRKKACERGRQKDRVQRQ